MANQTAAVELSFPDLAGLGATPAEVGALLDALAEVEADYDVQAEAAWVNGLSNSEFAEHLAGYQADQHLPGPELAGAGSDATYDLANQTAAIDVMLAAQTDREAARRREDADGVGRRGSTEVRLMAGMSRVARGTLTSGGTPATGLANDPDIDTMFGTGSVAGPAEIRAQLDYELRGGIPRPGPAGSRVCRRSRRSAGRSA